LTERNSNHHPLLLCLDTWNAAKQDQPFNIPCASAIALMLLALGWIHLVPMMIVPDLLDMIVTKSPLAIFILTWLCLGNTYLRTPEDRKKVHRWVGLGLTILVFLPNFYGGYTRSLVRTKVKWHCNGVVTSKYRSDNHQAASVTVEGDKPARFEGVDEEFYKIIEVGDSLTKEEWSSFGALNDKPVRIIWQGWCHGPKCRGID